MKMIHRVRVSLLKTNNKGSMRLYTNIGLVTSSNSECLKRKYFIDPSL
jgi:hypothetical protein